MSHEISKGDKGYVGSTSGAFEDRRCYFPCRNCKGLRPRRIIIKFVKNHYRDYGHIEGGQEYHPLVSYSLYVFVL